jgi:DNA-binding NarL/FixJ family response regulator
MHCLDMSTFPKIAGVAQSGVQAVHMTESLKPDIVIIDLGMPDMGGFEASLRV